MRNSVHTLVLLLLASVYSFLQDSSESEYANESKDSGLAKNRLDLMWSSVIGESGGVTSTQLSSFIRCCIETMSMICVHVKNTKIQIDYTNGICSDTVYFKLRTTKWLNSSNTVATYCYLFILLILKYFQR